MKELFSYTNDEIDVNMHGKKDIIDKLYDLTESKNANNKPDWSRIGIKLEKNCGQIEKYSSNYT